MLAHRTLSLSSSQGYLVLKSSGVWLLLMDSDMPIWNKITEACKVFKSIVLINAPATYTERNCEYLIWKVFKIWNKMKSFLGPQFSKSKRQAEKVVQLQIQTIFHDRKNNSGGRKTVWEGRATDSHYCRADLALIKEGAPCAWLDFRIARTLTFSLLLIWRRILCILS